MANETNAKVRLVRCPKCRLILQEHAEIPVYKCGGCGTVLQAKKKKKENMSAESTTRETIIERGQNLLQKAELSPPVDALQCENNEIREPNEQRGDERHLNGSSGGCENQTGEVDKEKFPLDQNDSGACESSDKEIASGFDRISSTDSLQNLLLDQPTVVSKSPTTRSYYAYDGSASSCDGDDRVPNRFSQQYISGNAGFISPDEFQSDYVNNIPRRMSKAQHYQDMNFSPMIQQVGDDKMELLRMVYELEDQLHKTRLGNGNSNNVFRAGGGMTDDDMHAPFFYNQFAPPRAHVNYYRRPARCGQTSSRVPFSGEAAHYRHRANSPRVRHWSAHLPRGCIYRNNGQPTVFFDHNYCNSHHSGSSCNGTEGSGLNEHGAHKGRVRSLEPTLGMSPQRYTSSEYSSSLHKDREMKRYAKRRLVLPIAGGAPIIACHYCSELLHMPADFAVFKRRWHQVRCNSCMKVLKFSVQNRIHVMPYLTETSTPPPSEVDSSGAPKLHYRPHAESVSYSDDMKPSFQSGSSEAEASSASSSEPMEDRKMKSVVMKESPTKLGNSNGTFKESGWVKSSSESEEAMPRTGPPLHRLMGYSTLSQVLNQKCFE